MGYMEYESNSLKDTKILSGQIIKEIISKKNPPVFIGLMGDLGAGKTSFVQGVSEFFCINDAVLSPTFVIQKIYEIKEENRISKGHSFKRLVHMDLYRLEDEKSLDAIKWEEYRNDKENILFVEWPNQIWKDFPEDMVLINIEHKGGDKRVIKINL
jgi:tRNA threonylcarbamoyladenosine biosynthesis protein TsaE